MANENLLLELETAANILLAPPSVVSHDQRQAAANVFIQFKTTNSPFQLCKHILETSQVDYVLFETAGLMKDALIREWKDLDKESIKALRAYLLQYVIGRHTLSPFVRERIVQVAAIIIKRQSVEDMGEDRRLVLAEVQQLIANGNMQAQMIGCSILAAMMQEYATTVKSSDVGLPWEVHFKAKKQFELTDLKSIFEFCLQALKQLYPNIPSTPALSPEMHNLVVRLTKLAEGVLSWTFINVNLPKKLISVFEADQNPSLRPGAQWKDTILQPSILQLFFKLHLRIRHDSELAHHTLNCLIQLSSLNGSVMVKKEARIEYLANFVTEFLHMLQELRRDGTAMQPIEALGCSNIIRKLILFFPPSIMVNLNVQLLEQYLQQVTDLTCLFMKTATQRATIDEDNDLYVEAFEHNLEAWVSVLHETQSLPPGFCRDAAVRIFDTYLQCHLSPPDGLRGLDSNNDVEEEEIDEVQEPDRQRYKDALATIGAFGREAPEHSLNVLTQLLEGRLSRLHGQIQRLISQGEQTIDRVLSDLYEDIHWLLLIAGNVITLDTDGETALIPSEIMRFSLAQAATINVEASLRLLASPGQPSSDIPGFESADPLIRIVANVFKLAEVEKRAVEAGFATLLSPEVGSTLMWLLRRWAVTYLSVQETFYSEISLALVTAFGQNTEGAAWSIAFLLAKILSNLTSPARNAEPLLVKDSVLLLVSLVDSKEKGRQVLKSDGLLGLIDLQANKHQHGPSLIAALNGGDGRSAAKAMLTLPSAAQQGMMKALALLAPACEDQASKEQYWSRVLKPLVDGFASVIGRPDFRRLHNDDQVRGYLECVLESFIGVVQGTQVSTATQLFSYLQPVLTSLIDILGLYHNYSSVVELILEVYCETAKRILCYLPQAESRILYQRSVELIQMYAKHNTGRRSVEKEAEEEQFRDLLLLMELLTNLLSKDFIDLAPVEEGQDDGVSAADVCLYGLDIVMPLMTLELLKFPTLCFNYFKTVTLLAEIYPEKICTLNPNLQKNLLYSLELGLTTLGNDNVYSLCCDFVQVLCCYMVRSGRTDIDALRQSLRPFLKMFLDLILSQNVNSDLLPFASSTLYVLICCYQDTYQELVHYLINAQADQVNRQRLTEAFSELTRNIPLTADRINRIRFRDAFDKFIVHVRGFLLVK